MEKCKHTQIYRSYDPISGTGLWDEATKKFGEIKLQKVERSYHQLNEEQRSFADETDTMWQCEGSCGNATITSMIK